MEAEKQRLEGELGAARRIMSALLPEEAPRIAGWELVPHIVSCTEVGGDLYDVFTLPDGRVMVAVGDVAGKGLGAALLVSSLLPLLRGLAGPCEDIAALVARLDAVLFPVTEPVRYATLFMGVLDPASGRFEYVNAGHNPPCVVRADGTVETLAPTGLPVALVGEGTWTSRVLELAPGDLLALFTDGIPEAWNEAEDEYGDERLLALLATQRGCEAAQVREAVLEDLRGFVGEARASDDVTLVLVRRCP
jgi:serine phosphatase RsbU (regulator of sigma subunit)